MLAVKAWAIGAALVIFGLAAGCGSDASWPGAPAPECGDCTWIIPHSVPVRPWRIVTDGEEVYWVSTETAELYSVPAAGGDVRRVASWVEASAEMAIDGQAIWSRESVPFVSGDGRLRRIARQTGESTLIAEGGVIGGPIALADGVFFLVTTSGGPPDLQRLAPGQTASMPVMRLPQEMYRPLFFTLAPRDGGMTAAWSQPLDPIMLDVMEVPGGNVRTAALPGVRSYPSLVMLGDRLFVLPPDANASLWRLDPTGGPVAIAGGFARGWLSAADPYLLVTERDAGRVSLIDGDGATVWSRTVPLVYPTAAVTVGRAIYVAGELGMLRFPWPEPGR
jgi:hypothetical protein